MEPHQGPVGQEAACGSGSGSSSGLGLGLGQRRRAAAIPPSTSRVAPWTNAASSEARNRTAYAILLIFRHDPPSMAAFAGGGRHRLVYTTAIGPPEEVAAGRLLGRRPER
ncbi:hypothetical protein RVR_10549 [Actinacidiphila reveromycinica]|uniref:Uncharacterized protein n=1 Tax=Actinacidiphila reveromycinica TaxID=659352 RepID=A0A7U3V0C1_9ACTN|nr:hypothetical protein RVR_10549 [Streptomyces sp. SN-593]